MVKMLSGCLLFVVTLCCCYQDLPLAEDIGEIARSPVFFLLPLMIIIDFFIKDNGIGLQKISSIFKKLFYFYLIGTTCGIIVYVSINGFRFNYLDENILIKPLKVLLYYILFYYIIKASYKLFILSDFFSIKVVFFSLISLHFWIAITETIEAPYAFSFLHTYPIYYRVRLLTSEASWTGSIIITLSFIYLSLSRGYNLIYGLIFLIVNLALTESKLLLMGSFLTLIIWGVSNKHISKKYIFLLLIIILPLGYYFLYDRIIDLWTTDLFMYTSTVTRGAATLTGYSLLFKYPLGIGGTYYYFISTEISNVASFFVNFLGVGNTDEIDSLGMIDDKFLTSGSTFAESIVLCGFPGLIICMRFFKTLIQLTNKNQYLKFAVIYFILSNIITEVMVNRVIWAVLFGFIAYQNDLKIQESKNNNI